MRLDHINLRAGASEMAAVKRFYEEALGLKEGFRPAFGSQGHWLYAGGQAVVHLSLARASRGTGRGGLDHVAFNVASLDPVLRYLERSRVPYETMKVEETGLTQVFFEDPLGNRLEINARD